MKYKIAVLDDYQNVALESADWSALGDRVDITAFQDHLDDTDAVIERLLPFDSSLTVARTSKADLRGVALNTTKT